MNLRTKIFAVMCAAAAGALAASGPALAQQKTVKACQDEWRANKDANQAAGITEKAYVDKCRAGGGAAAPAATPPATPAAAPAAPAAAPAAGAQKTVKACQQEWQANKAAYQAASVTEKAYVDKCRAGEAIALPAAPSPAPTMAAPAAPAGIPAAPAKSPATPASAPATKPSSVPATAAAGANQFTVEAQAKSHCPADTVVWANLESKIYHFSGHKDYGNTKEGAYMCEKDAQGQGIRAAKNEKHP